MNKVYIGALFRSIRDQIKQELENRSDIPVPKMTKYPQYKLKVIRKFIKIIRPDMNKAEVERILPMLSFISRLPMGMKHANDMDEEDYLKMMEFIYVVFLMIDAYCEQEGVVPFKYNPKFKEAGLNETPHL